MNIIYQRIKNIYLSLFFLSPKLLSTIIFIPFLYICGWILARPIVLLGVDKEKSARFSFLMVVPVIFGMMAKTIYDGEIPYNESSLLPLFIGFIFAFLTGIFACKWMIKLVKNSQLKYFAYYCFIIGSITMTTVLWIS